MVNSPVSEPRWLDADATAEYISVRAEALRRLVKQGRIPAPNYDLGPRSPRWDRLALDAHFEGGSASTNVDEMVRAYAKKLSETARPRRKVLAG